jgi:hypothetical protein
MLGARQRREWSQPGAPCRPSQFSTGKWLKLRTTTLPRKDEADRRRCPTIRRRGWLKFTEGKLREDARAPRAGANTGRHEKPDAKFHH